jgi:hypothetical protein
VEQALENSRPSPAFSFRLLSSLLLIFSPYVPPSGYPRSKKSEVTSLLKIKNDVFEGF